MLQEIENLMRVGNWVEAIALCRKSIREHPTNGMLYALEGMCHYRMAHFTEAETAFRRACLLDPKISEAAVKQAQCLEKLGRYKDAMDVVKEWMPKRPNDIALQALFDFLKTKDCSEEHDRWEKSRRFDLNVISSVGSESMM